MNECDDNCTMAERFERTMSELNKRFDGMEQMLRGLDHHITGNGTPERGLLIRLDRIEQKSVAQSKTAGYAIAVASTALAGIIVQVVMFVLKKQ